MIKKNTLLKPVTCSAILFSISFLLLPNLLNAAEVITVESKDTSSQTVLGSTVIPYKEVTLSAQIPGRIISITGDVGTMLAQGDFIVKINDDGLQAKRKTALAGLNSAQASYNNAQTQHNREIVSPKSKNIGGMPGMGMPAMMDIFMTQPMYEMMGDYDKDTHRNADLTNSSTAVSQAKSQIMQAQSQLNEIDAALRNSYSIAPFKGMILEKMVEVGDTVQPGQPLIKFADVSFKRLEAAVPSMMVGNLKKGMVVPVTINGNLRTEAKVAQIYPIADAQRHTVTVKFDLRPNINAAPGMYAEISIPNRSQGQKSVVVIPRSTLLKGRSLSSVMRINDEGKTELRLVRLGATQSDGSVAVVSGLQAGDRVLNHPPANVVSGTTP